MRERAPCNPLLVGCLFSVAARTSPSLTAAGANTILRLLGAAPALTTGAGLTLDRMTADASTSQPLGWIVTVATPGVGGGDPSLEVYFVAISDQVDAIDAVKAVSGAGQGCLVVAHQ